MKVFRKIVTMIMLAGLCAMALTGCGNIDGESQGNTITEAPITSSAASVDTNNSAETSAMETQDNSSTDASFEETQDSTIDLNENDELKQLAFVYQENTITLSDIVDDQKIENMLGKANEIKSHTYNQDDGTNLVQLYGMTEKQYYFPGLVIKTIDGTNDKKFIIFNIEITDSKYPTVGGIKVGDSFEKLKEAYPEGNLLGGELSDAEDDFRFEPVDYVNVMYFHIKDRKVESIIISTLLD